MNRDTLVPIAIHMMHVALNNLVRDGYVAFAAVIIDKDNSVTPIQPENSSNSQKEAFGSFLRIIAPHVEAIIIISEAWTLSPEDVNDAALTVRLYP